MAKQQKQKIKGCRKGNRNRNSPANTAYIAEGRRRKNKIRKLESYCAKNPNDKQAQAALEAVKENFDY